MNEAVKATNIDNAEPIIDIENLSISFFTRRGEIPVVMDFSCKVMPGEARRVPFQNSLTKAVLSVAIVARYSGASAAFPVSSAIRAAASSAM